MTKVSKKPKMEIRPRRIFSEALKRKIVEELSNKMYNVTDAGRMYEVSNTTVYRWLYLYSPHYKRQVKQVVEMESQEYQHKALLQKIAEIERAFGRKQLEVDYLNKLIEISSEELGIDLKKNFAQKLLNGSGNTSDNTFTK